MIPHKLVEATFRRWYLLVLPVVITPLLVYGFTRPATTYQSSANIWVSKPSGLSGSSLAPDPNSFLTPAQSQAQIITDLLATRSFREAVDGRVSGHPGGQADYVQREVSVAAAGTNLVSVSVKDSSPSTAKALVAAVLAEYEQRAVDESVRESGVVADYYTQQLTPARQELTSRQQALTNYMQAHPGSASVTSTDATYLGLVQSVSAQNQTVSDIQSSLQAAQLAAVSGPDSQRAIFNIIDQPREPEGAVQQPLSKRVAYPGAGLLLGLLLGCTAIYLVYRADHTIRSGEDLRGLGVPLLGAVPLLKVPRWGPLGMLPAGTSRRRDFARRVAASITSPE